MELLPTDPKGIIIMLKTLGMTVISGALLLTAGCLKKETSQTLYLAPDGSVAWVASEDNVYSDETDLGKRIAEEQQYIGPALLGTHGVARALAALSPQSAVRTTILRDERPFHVVTDARFRAVDRVLERVFTDLGVRTSASLLRDADHTALRVSLDFSQPLAERETPVSELFDLDHFRFVLTDGRFGAVTGFDVTEGMVAVLSPEWRQRADKASETKGTIEFTLSWTTD
jgi:hypothetical protein